MTLRFLGRYIASADTTPAEDARPLDGDTIPSDGDTTPSDGDTTPPGGDTTPPGGDTTPSDGDTTPSDGDTTPSDGDTTPSDGDTTPSDGDTPPSDGDTTPSGGDTTPSDGDTTPSDGDTTPSDGDTTPSDGDTPPSDGDTTPSGGDTTPSDGDTTPSDDGEIHSILQSLREELAEKDSDIERVADSLSTFVDHMIEAEELQIEKEALTALEEEARAQALADLMSSTLSVPGYEDWGYPITVEYTVYPYGAGYNMDASETFDSPDVFMTRHEENVSFCQPGGTLKDYYIRYIYDSNDELVYDYQAGIEEPPPEEPVEDLSPVILETLQSIDSRLEAMGADISTISTNSLDYHTGMTATQDDIRQLQTMNLVTNMAIGFSVFLLLGYIIAHNFWQRMKVG